MPATRFFLTPTWFKLLSEHGSSTAVTAFDCRFGELTLILQKVRTGLTALTNYYSPSFYPTEVDGVRSHLSAVEAQGFAQQLRQLCKGQLLLGPVHADALWLSQLANALRQAGFVCDFFTNSTNWYLPCAALSFDTWLSERPSRLRNTLKRCETKLRQTAGFALVIHQHNGPELEKALQDYNKVYAASWKTPEPCPQFIPELARHAARGGQLRLGILSIEGEAIAAQLWLVDEGVASIYKLAYDEAWRKTGAGTVLTAALTRHVLEQDKVHEIDFLTGNDQYKMEWMTHSRPLVSLLAFNLRHPRGLALAILHFGAKKIRQLRSKFSASQSPS